MTLRTAGTELARRYAPRNNEPAGHSDARQMARADALAKRPLRAIPSHRRTTGERL
jgi:hypothetical protein